MSAAKKKTSGGGYTKKSSPPHAGFWLQPKPRRVQLDRCIETSKRKDMPDGLVAVNALLVDGFRVREHAPMETLFAANGANGAPSTRIMTIFEVLPEGLLFHSNPGARVDELRADPRASLTLWMPLLGAFASIDGHVEIHDLLPEAPRAPGEPEPCPCQVPSGHPLLVRPSMVRITRVDRHGGFSTQTFEFADQS